MRLKSPIPRSVVALVLGILGLGSLTALAQPQANSAHVNLYFAQVADGSFEGGRWQTALTIVNSNEKDAIAEVRFFSSNGGPMLVDLGNGPKDRHPILVPALGSLTLASRPTGQSVRAGWARVYSTVPLVGSASFRLWLGDRAVQEVTAPPTLPTTLYLSYANRQLGVAIANPKNRTLSVVVRLMVAGTEVSEPVRIVLPPYGHTSFNAGDKFPRAGFQDAVLSIEGEDLPWDEFLAWTMNADPSGTFSSLPPGNFSPPISHWDRIWNVYQRVLNFAQELGYITTPPRLNILYDRQVNAYARGGTEVGIYIGLSELLGDSDSELAHVAGHELGHIVQQRTGVRYWYPANAELDADIWGTLFAMGAGYDAYAAAGSLAKLAMATGRAALATQLFEDVSTADAHRSFNTRLDAVYDFLVLLCSSDIGRPFCRDYKRIMHPHLPDSAPLSLPELEAKGYRIPDLSQAFPLLRKPASPEGTVERDR